MLTRLRSTLIVLAASAGLGGCVGMDPYGYSGVSVGYGGGYSPYGYGGYGDPYGAYGYGSSYGYGSPYYGWYDDYYYPGTGYYVYSRGGDRYRWSDAQRRYWESRRSRHQSGANWTGYRGPSHDWRRDRDRSAEGTFSGGMSSGGTRELRRADSGSTGVREGSRRSGTTWQQRHPTDDSATTSSNSDRPTTRKSSRSSRWHKVD